MHPNFYVSHEDLELLLSAISDAVYLAEDAAACGFEDDEALHLERIQSLQALEARLSSAAQGL